MKDEAARRTRPHRRWLAQRARADRYMSIRQSIEAQYGDQGGIEEAITCAPADVRRKADAFLKLKSVDLAERSAGELTEGAMALGAAASGYQAHAESVFRSVADWNSLALDKPLENAAARAYGYHALRQQLSQLKASPDQAKASLCAFHQELNAFLEENGASTATPASIEALTARALKPHHGLDTADRKSSGAEASSIFASTRTFRLTDADGSQDEAPTSVTLHSGPIAKVDSTVTLHVRPSSSASIKPDGKN